MANTTFTVVAQGGSITGGLVATCTTASGLAGSVDFRGQGKFYFECTWNVFASAGIGIGLGDRGLLGLGAQNGAPNIVLIFPNQLSSGIYGNTVNTGVNLGANCVVNDVICVAADLTAGLIWFRRNAGNWNGSGAANPATGVGGLNYLQYWPANSISLSGLAPYAFMFGSGDKMTLNFGDTAFAQTAPVGFGNWTVATGMKNRASAVYAEIVGSGSPKSRVSSLYAEVIGVPPGLLQLSNQYVEVSASGPGQVTLSALYAEVIAALPPGAVVQLSNQYVEDISTGNPVITLVRLSNQYVEVVTSVTPFFPAPPEARAMVMV